MNTKNNGRSRATNDRIENALIELLQTHELSQISVTKIIKISGINRSTFYSHYADIFALADSLRDKLEREVEHLYSEEGYNYGSYDYLRLFNHIRNNRSLYRTYFKLGYDKKHKISFYGFAQDEMIPDDKNLDYHLEFFKAGFTAIVKKWLDSNCRESPEEMDEILKKEYNDRIRN